MSTDQEFSMDEECSFIQWFCSHEEHAWFCQVDPEFIRDVSNLHGIKHRIPKFNELLSYILKPDIPTQEDVENPRFELMYDQLRDLYGLIHARFILTPKGLNLMREKYLTGEFGVCQRVYCQGQNVIPIGVSQQLKTCRVKVYCPKCQDVYNLPNKKKFDKIDGAYFGGSFPHILLMSFSDLEVKKSEEKFIPQIYGFKIHGKAGSIEGPPVLPPHKISPEPNMQDKSLAKTSVSRHKTKPQKKHK